MGQTAIRGSAGPCAPRTKARGINPCATVRRSRLGEARSVQVPCAFCNGTGKDPFGIMSRLSTCCVCQGRGVVAVEDSHEWCAHCGGTGAVKRLTCTVCGGRGVLPVLKGPTEVCPECGGSGDDPAAPAMACLECRGRGKVPAAGHGSPRRAREAADKRNVPPGTAQ